MPHPAEKDGPQTPGIAAGHSHHAPGPSPSQDRPNVRSSTTCRAHPPPQRRGSHPGNSGLPPRTGPAPGALLPTYKRGNVPHHDAEPRPKSTFTTSRRARRLRLLVTAAQSIRPPATAAETDATGDSTQERLACRPGRQNCATAVPSLCHHTTIGAGLIRWNFSNAKSTTTPS